MTEFCDTDCEECGQPNATCACDKLWRLAESRGHVMELQTELATTKALLKGARQEIDFSMRRQTTLQAELDALRPRMQELSEGRIAAEGQVARLVNVIEATVLALHENGYAGLSDRIYSALHVALAGKETQPNAIS